MTPAEIIARACTPAPDECWHGSGSAGPSGGDFTCHIYMWEREMPRAKAILSAITSAGIRLIPAGEYDPVTIEAAASVSEKMHDSYIASEIRELMSKAVNE